MTSNTFIKLHQNGREFLVNLSTVSEMYGSGYNNSWLYFNFTVDKEQVRFTVDETLEEILELISKVSL